MSTLLTYADLPTRYGIVYEKTPDGVVISIPPSRRWPYLLGAAAPPLLIAVWLVAAVVHGLIDAAPLWSEAPSALIGELLAMAVAGWIAYSIVQACRRRLNRRTIINVTEAGLSVAVEQEPGKLRRQMWPRDQVLEIRPGPVPWNASEKHSMGLHLRVRGREIVEIVEGHDAAVADWLADTLRGAMGLDGKSTGL